MVRGVTLVAGIENKQWRGGRRRRQEVVTGEHVRVCECVSVSLCVCVCVHAHVDVCGCSEAFALPVKEKLQTQLAPVL